MLPAYSGDVEIRLGKVFLKGILRIPKDPCGAVLFAHGSGSGRLSPRNRFVAEELGRARLATLLFDLLTAAEEREDLRTARLRFDIPFLADRLIGVTDWFCERTVHALAVGYFGASTGAAAALIASTKRLETVQAVVSRGGRPDLAGEEVLASVKAPTLFIVGGDDAEVLELNRLALRLLAAEEKKLITVPGATHLFEEPGALERAAELAAAWFTAHLGQTLPQAKDPRS
jgi:predicted alpha/beta-hydrolase family hydrolase